MIAIVCPVGHLDRWGYQHAAGYCLRSMVAWADAVYVMASCPDADLTMPHCCGATVVSDGRTWFPDGQYERQQVVRNVNLGFEMARQDGHKVALEMSVTAYIPEWAWGRLLEKAAQMLREGRGFDWLYRRDQLGPWLTRTRVRLPFMVNLQGDYRYSPAADAIECGTYLYRQEYGGYGEHDSEAIIDVPLELTEPDLRAKMAWLRNYDGVGKKRPAYSWGYWLDYYRKKLGRRPLDRQVDNEIARNTRPDFVSAYVLETMGVTK